MSISPLTIVSAGAGSGKTHRIQTSLFEWIDSGLVAPEKIVAVTFTEAAAGELRERIREKLISEGKLEEALKLEQAYISTIHSFGLRILTEFAFEAGGSPALRMLNEDEQEVLLRRSLSGSDENEHILRNLEQYGYRYDFMSGRGGEDSFRGRILDLIGKLKNIGHGLESDLPEHALDTVRAIYGPTPPAEELNTRLLTAVNRLLGRFPDDLSTLFPGNKSATNALEADFRNLTTAARGNALECDWRLWESLRDLRQSKRGTELPEGYDALADDVMAAAGAIERHPGPLAQALDHVKALISTAQTCLGEYTDEKRDRGLLDFQDMLTQAHDLLFGNAKVRETLAERIDCLIIDEFQDTNPLQFALLWVMREAGVPTLVVGDLKQAIMGFQGADPRLMEALIQSSRGACSPQTENWRSQKRLMDWINGVGAGLFGAEYVPLTPRAAYESRLDPIDILSMLQAPRYGSSAIPAQHAALYLQKLMEDPEQTIFDRHRGEHRRLKAGDLAVICPSHAKLGKYAEALQALGIQIRIASDGWFESTAVQIAFHALSLVADCNDRHARLYIAVTQLGSHTLESALTGILEQNSIDDPLVDKLLALNDGADMLPVDELLSKVLDVMDLYSVVSLWPDADQERANLLRLQEEAREFMNANRNALATAGYFGSGLKTFMAWLRGRADRDNSRPEPRAYDENAVVLTTWHSSKGREWPIVFVAGIDAEVRHKLPHTRVVYEQFGDLVRILDQARLEILPGFDCKETRDRFLEQFRSEVEQDARRLLYVALTRAREKMILEWPGYQAGDDMKTYWQMLTAWTGMTLSDGKLAVNGTEHRCRVQECDRERPPIFEVPPERAQVVLPGFGRRALAAGKYLGPVTPESSTPSALKKEAVGIQEISNLEVKSYGERLNAEFDMPEADRGTLIHRCFEVLGACPGLENLKTACEFEFNGDQEAAVRLQVSAFYAWVQRELNPVGMGFETPFLLQNDAGTVISGIIDLVVETEKGVWIIDHKSDQVEDRKARFAEYLPQLDAYAVAVRQAWPHKPLLGIGINWATPGEVMLRHL